MLSQRRWQIAWGGLAGLLFVAGEMYIFRSRYGLGAVLSLASIFCGAMAYALPLLPWPKDPGALWRELRDKSGSLAALLKLKKELKPMTATSKPVRKRSNVQATGPRLAWLPFASDTLTLTRHVLTVPLAVLAFGVYFWALPAGRMALSIAGLAAFLLVMTVYLQNLEQPLVLLKLNHNFKCLLKLLLGLPLQAYGFWLLWGYQHIYAGYLLVILGSALMLAVLLFSPFDLVAEKQMTEPELNQAPVAVWWTSQRMALKSSLVAGSAILAYLAIEVLAGRQPGLSVTCGFLSIALLLLSFPWLPSSLASWEAIPKLPRALGALALGSVAFLLGIRGQAFINAGGIHAGLWCFLLAAVILVLALPHRPKSDASEMAATSSKTLYFEMAAVFLLFLVSLLLRAPHLETFPYGAEGDEAGGGVFAVDVIKGRVDNAFVTANVPLYYYSVTAVFFKIFGLSLAAMRAHAVIFGVLSVLTTYFFLRLFFGALVSYGATLLMSFSYWHLHYSRFGHYNIEQVMMQMAAFYFIFKAMMGGKTWHYIVGGLAFGFAMLPHLASRLLPFEGIALVLYFFLTRRDLLRRYLPGFLMFVIAAWMVAAPCLTYWFRAIHASLGRAQSVSIFDKTNSNAPTDTLSGFVHNSKISMLMFNDYSDSRTRDNPLAPQKILENWTAILFALAFAYMLYHWRDPLAFFLLSAFFINLSASVFAVEAPQTLRTAGNISIVFCVIAFFLNDIRGAFELLGRRLGVAVFAAILIPSLAFFSYRSWEKYFVEARKLAFDATPTYVAAIAGQKGGSADQAVFFAQGFAASHPPVLLFAQDTPIRNFFNISDYLPVSVASDRTHLLFFCDVFESVTPWVQTLYPTSKAVAIPHLTYPGQNLGTYFIASKGEIATHLGLNAVVDGARSVKNAPLEFPSKEIPAAHRIHWEGSVRLENYGFYKFFASGTGDCQIRLAGQTVYSRSGGVVRAPELRLPMGLLPIEADCRPGNSHQAFKISWTGKPHPGRMLYSFHGSSSGTLDKRQLFDYPVEGFYGQYYVSREFKGDSVMEYVEPVLLARWLDSPLPGNWSARWSAKLQAPLAGLYRFSLNAPGGFAEVRVDGKLVYRAGTPPVAELQAPRVFPTIELSAGEHAIEARFFTAGPSWYDLHWTPPGQSDQLLLPKYLRPVYPRF
jgi:hypothetical protein